MSYRQTKLVGNTLPDYESRTITDILIDALTPLMIMVMVWSVVFFLLEIRYVYSEVHDANLRFVAFLFVMGVVALNRLIAVDNSAESPLYAIALGGAIGMYTLATTGAYGVGSVAGGFMNQPWVATGFNVTVVALLWWLTNRLTHECCVDENSYAGDIGILTGTLRRMQAKMQPDTKEAKSQESFFVRKSQSSIVPSMDLMPFDPTEWEKPSSAVSATIALEPDRPMSKRHPGISILYFSAPVMLVFVLGLSVLEQGGDSLILWGHFYVGCYTVSALSLLMLSSLGGLREYFRSRRIHIPAGIGPFWIGLGFLQIAIVLIVTIDLPMPTMPAMAYVTEHQMDPFNRNSTFQLRSTSASPVELAEQSVIVERISLGVQICLGLFIAYSLLRGIGAAALRIAKNRRRLPRPLVRMCDAVDSGIQRVLRLPSLPKLPRRIRVSPEVASCSRYTNPLASAGSARLTPRDVIEQSYQALCALAYDMGVPRRVDQTPYEFIDDFPKQLKSLREEAIELTDLYVLSAYSPAIFDERTLDRVRKFWTSYERVRGRVVR